MNDENKNNNVPILFISSPIKFLFFLTSSVLMLHNSAKSQNRDSINLYINKAVSIFQKESLYAGSIDWKIINDSLKFLLEHSNTYKQADETIIWLFSKLKDKHGFISTKDTFYKYAEPKIDRLSAGIKEEYLKPRSINIRMLTENIGYYKMPAVIIGSDKLKMKEWSNKLRDSLCRLLHYDPKGLIIDLRMNNGGNSAPMFEAFKIVLNESYNIFYVDRNLVFSDPQNDKDSSSVIYRNSAAPDRTCLFNTKIPIAVLIGPATASSGEILAMALASRNDTKLFGEKTSGNCNSTKGFATNINSFYVLLTVSNVADYKKRINTASIIKPDVYVKSEDNYANLLEDITVKKAKIWLKKNYKLR